MSRGIVPTCLEASPNPQTESRWSDHSGPGHPFKTSIKLLKPHGSLNWAQWTRHRSLGDLVRLWLQQVLQLLILKVGAIAC
jgi:hypothetical protein